MEPGEPPLGMRAGEAGRVFDPPSRTLAARKGRSETCPTFNRLALGLMSVLAVFGLGRPIRAADTDALLTAQHRIAADAPEWRELAAAFAKQPDTLADFEEQRFFPFRKEPTVLRGEVRVARAHGLSLHYREPETRIIVLDREGMLVREVDGRKSPPLDPRAKAGVAPLLDILRFDFAALEKAFELHGLRDGDVWALALRPRDAAVQRAIGDIFVSGEGTVVRTIELRRSAKQRIAIAIAPPRATTAFSAAELKQYFR
jgi:hypothetical protein